MGAWGIKTFENDDSSDWLYNLEETSDLSVIEAALAEADSEYIEVPEGCTILAAAEVILALAGNARDNFPENAVEWVSKNSALDVTHLKQNAIKAIDAVLSEKSELKELWQESEEFEKWERDVQDMKSALA